MCVPEKARVCGRGVFSGLLCLILNLHLVLLLMNVSLVLTGCRMRARSLLSRRFNPLLKCTWIPYSDLKFCYKRALLQVTVLISKEYSSSDFFFLPTHTLLSSSTSRRVWFRKNELRSLSQKSEARCYAALAHQRSSAKGSRENSFLSHFILIILFEMSHTTMIRRNVGCRSLNIKLRGAPVMV